MASLFNEENHETLRGLVRRAPLGSVVIEAKDRLEALHIPFLERLATDNALLAHVPRSSPLVAAAGQPCLVIFNGANGYITPSWYATKKEHGKAVPTWNYAVVHVRGRIHLHPETEWIRHQIEALTEQFEQHRVQPWSMDDAPKAYTDRMLRALIGIEISVESISGVTKASQNQPAENQRSVLEGLDAEQPGSGLTTWMKDVYEN